MSQKTTDPPRVFISYSWTSEDHTEWVADLGERMMSDGVDVVLDQWSLKDGQDLNSFMEQMVTDASIKRVIIISDEAYAKKANNRKGGVGTESQIISQEVYEKVDQEKFVPIVRERDGDGKACLPVFLKSRKYIDFSDVDTEAEAYDALLRNIYERPRRRKPALGNAPAELFDETAVRISAASKSKRLRELVTSGRGNPSAAFEDFTEEFLANFEDLRLRYSYEQKDTWCQSMFDNIATARAHRDVAIDAVHTGAMHVRDEWFMAGLCTFLERLLPYQERPQQMGQFFECSEDNYKFLVWEIFLYTVASFIKARRFSDVRQLLTRSYVVPEHLDSSKTVSQAFTRYEAYPQTLENDCATRGDTKRLSVMADLLHDRADRRDARFSDLAQADVVCCLAAGRDPYSYGWYPRSLIYSGELGKLELFARATTAEGFAPFREMLGYATAQELIEHICSEKMVKIWHGERTFRSIYIEELFNLQELRIRWTAQAKKS